MLIKYLYYFIIPILLINLSYGFEMVSRSEWNARPPRSVANLNKIPSYVFIHHSYIPGACYNLSDCINAMKTMQNLHMDNNSISRLIISAGNYLFHLLQNGMISVTALLLEVMGECTKVEDGIESEPIREVTTQLG